MKNNDSAKQFLADYVSIETEGNLILLKNNQMITLHFANEKGEFKSFAASCSNMAKILYDSTPLSDSVIGYFKNK